MSSEVFLCLPSGTKERTAISTRHPLSLQGVDVDDNCMLPSHSSSIFMFTPPPPMQFLVTPNKHKSGNTFSVKPLRFLEGQMSLDL